MVDNEVYRSLLRDERAAPGNKLANQNKASLPTKSAQEAKSLKENASGEFAVPKTDGILAAFSQAWQDTQGTSDTAREKASQGIRTTDFFSNLFSAIAEKGSVNLAAIMNGGKSVEVVTTDLYSTTLQELLGSDAKSGLASWSLQVTTGVVAVENDTNSSGELAGSIGLKIPLGAAGTIGVGLGAYKDSGNWERGLYFSLNIAGSKPVAQ